MSEQNININTNDNLKCKICSYLKDVDPEIVNYANTLIKKNSPISEIDKVFKSIEGLTFSKYHYFDVHKVKCLSNFTLSENNKSEFQIPVIQEIDIASFEQLSQPEKNKSILNLASNLLYKALSETMNTPNFYKESASSIKTYHEIVKDYSVNFGNIKSKDKEISSPEDLENLSFKVVSSVLDNELVSPNTAVKLAIMMRKDSSELSIFKNNNEIIHTDSEKEEIVAALFEFRQDYDAFKEFQKEKSNFIKYLESKKC